MEHLLIALGLCLSGATWAIASVLRARYRHKSLVAYRSVVMTLSVTSPEQVPDALRAIWGQPRASDPKLSPPAGQSGQPAAIEEHDSDE